MTRSLIGVVLSALAMVPAEVCAQGNAGWLRGAARDALGRSEPSLPITIQGTAGARWQLRTDAEGGFAAVLPFGEYRIVWPGGDGQIEIPALGTTICEIHAAQINCRGEERSAGPDVPSSYSLAGWLLHNAPGVIPEPLDTNGIGSNVLAGISDRAVSWTATSYRLQGLNATDPYQAGRPVLLADTQAVAEVAIASGPEVNVFVRRAPLQWHGLIASDDTGGGLAPSRPLASSFESYTRDHVETGGPLQRLADIFLSSTGQWGAQTVPQGAPSDRLNSRMLFANADGRVNLGRAGQITGQFTGSRLDRSGWSLPAGVEALAARRMSPELFPNGALGETDHLDFAQAGWTRPLGSSGLMEVRYGYSTAHLDTHTEQDFAPGAQSRIELDGGAMTGPPPLQNLGVRTRHQAGFVAQPGEWRWGPTRHRLEAGAHQETAHTRNRFDAPSDLNVITAEGSAASVLELNTPLDSRSQVTDGSAEVRDTMALGAWFLVDAGVRGEFSRGSLPAQSSPAGQYVGARQFASQADLISWNSAAPHVGFALSPPQVRRLTLRASYSRWLAPLSGRYLDFGNPNSLGGLEYLWQDTNGDGRFEPGEQGALVSRFGGPYSQIDSRLKRPYADEINVGAALALPRQARARVQLFRRDEKDRIAAVNVGVPPDSFQARVIPDPGPDFVPGTFDDQQLVIYAQDAATLGKDRFRLTNPPDLRMLYSGVLAAVGMHARNVGIEASFLAEKSYGPTNRGNAIWENDSGVVGALYQDPNTLLHAAGRDFFDRAYVGKVQASGVLPARLGKLQIASVVTYLDGLVFGRELLITGLPQGPFLVNATVRGSPEGGQRTEYVLNWDLRVSRSFRTGPGRLTVRADCFNLLNGSNKVAEDAFSGPLFDSRMALAVQTPRFVRFGFQFGF